MKTGTKIVIGGVVLIGVSLAAYFAYQKYMGTSSAPSGTLTATTSSNGTQVYVDQAGKIFDQAGNLLQTAGNAATQITNALKPSTAAAPGIQVTDSAGRTFRFSNNEGGAGWKIVINGAETNAQGTELFIVEGWAYHKNKKGEYWKYTPADNWWQKTNKPASLSGLGCACSQPKLNGLATLLRG